MLNVAIAGVSSSGKTTLANKIKAKVPNSRLIHMDDYYKQPENIPRIPGTNRFNLDIPESFDFEEYTKALNRLKLGHSGLIVAEGLYSFLNNSSDFHHRIFLDVDFGSALSRRPAHYENDEQYLNIIKQAKKDYIDRQMARATRIIQVTPETTPGEVFEEVKQTVGF